MTTSVSPKEGDIKIKRGVKYIRRKNPWYSHNPNGFYWIICRGK